MREEILIWWTGCIILAYTVCTALMLIGQQEANNINKDPFLRLQWHDIGATEQEPFKTYKRIKKDDKDGDRAKTIDKLYNSFTDLQLVNDGNGSGKDLQVNVEYLNKNQVIKQIKNVTAMGPKGQTQLKYLEHPGSNRHQVFNDEEKSYKEPFRITIDYKDSQGMSKTVSFVSDERYNDGFKMEDK